MDWKQLLVYITGSVEEELLLRIEYLVAENRTLRDQIKGRVQLSDTGPRALAEIGKKLSKQALEQVASIVKPDAILAWHRKLVAQKFDGSKQRQSPGRPRVDPEIEELVLRMARENRSWDYDCIQGALMHLGYAISDQTVGHILKRHGLQPAPERKQTTMVSARSVIFWSTTSTMITKNVLIRELAMSFHVPQANRPRIMRESFTVMSDSVVC